MFTSSRRIFGSVSLSACTRPTPSSPTPSANKTAPAAAALAGAGVDKAPLPPQEQLQTTKFHKSSSASNLSRLPYVELKARPSSPFHSPSPSLSDLPALAPASATPSRSPSPPQCPVPPASSSSASASPAPSPAPPAPQAPSAPSNPSASSAADPGMAGAMAEMGGMDLQEIARIMQLQASALAEQAKSMSARSMSVRDDGAASTRGMTSPETARMTIYNHPLPQGVDIPRLGLGVFMASPQEAEEAIQFAFAEGYRHVDTARLYKNEAAVGRAVRNSGIPREEIFVTTKLWNSDHGYQNTLTAFQKSLSEMGLDYVDLFLIHSPLRVDSRLETWKACEEILRSGKAKSIGVSNYGIHHLEELMASCTFTPAVNQVELHPFCTRQKLVEFCRSHGIALQAYSPLTKGKRLKDPTLVEIAGHYKKSTAQLLIRWGLQKDFVVLPKSVTPSRIAANAQVFNFEISPEDMAALDALNEDFVTGWDPTRSS